jgi:predicted dehydrogenase
MAIKALQSGKHVLVEKPMALNARECEEMIRCAQDNDRVLMVDHTFLYTGAVRRMKEIVEKGDIGDIYYFDSVRVNLGLFQHDVNVIWDLAPHDLSIMDFLLTRKPKAVSAVGVNHYNHMEDVAYLILHFGEKMMAHVHVNWLAPVKIRRILIGGSKKMIVFDDMEPSEKVKVYDTGVKVVTREGIYKTLVEYRTGDMFAPKLDQSEALSLVIDDFLESIKTGRAPVADGETGLRVVRVLEAAELSIKKSGELVSL